MATASEEALRAIFEQIRDERKTHANTATRIGDAFLSLLSHLDNGTFLKQGDTESTEYILSVTGGASASLTKLFTLETVTEQGEERVTLATPLAPFKELELREHLQIGDARLRWDSERQALYVTGKDGSTPVGFYSTGWLSAKGANDSQGEGGGGGGISYSRLDSWEGYTDEEKGGWVLSAYLGVRLHQDIENLKSGVAMSYAVQGTGNAITDVTRDGARWVFTRGKTFSELGHLHWLSDISDLHSSWDSLLKAEPTSYVTRWPSWGEVTGKPTTFTPSSHTHPKSQITDFPTTWAWSAISGKPTSFTPSAHTHAIGEVTGLQSALDAKLPAATFEELFEKVTLSSGETAIRAKFGLYSDKWLSAKGANDTQGEGGGGGLSYSRLDSWEGYSDEEKGGWVLSAYLGVRLHQDIENLKSGVAMSYSVQGTGNAITDVTRDSSRWVFTRGKAFSELGHLHKLSDISDLHSSWDAVLKAAPAESVTRWPSWGEVTGKPTTFTPSSHKHVKADITDFPTTWAWSAISGKPSSFTPSAHTHPLADISDLHASWDAILKVAPTAYVTRWPSWGEVTGKPSTFTPSSHTHTIAQVTGLQSALDAKLNAAVFEELFEKVTLSSGETAIRAKFGLYSDKWLSAKGANPNQGESGGGGVAYSRLDSWEGYDSATMDGWVLSAKLGYGLYQDVESMKGSVATSYTIQGTGNALTDVTKDGNRWTFTRGATFAALSHNHYLSSISDLNASWDAILKTEPSAYVTRWPAWGEVTGKPSSFTPSGHTHGMADISDLNANWDALLKAAPSAYLTRWPSVSEVTGKQNLVVKLNGGGTEGTNLFTYNGTAAKAINITASSIGAAASSHSHSQYLTGITKSMVEAVLTGNITSHTHSQYLTSHQAIYALTVKAGSTSVLSFNPKGAAATLTIKAGTNVSLSADATSHAITINNTYTYTHPSATATTIAAATGMVLSAITVNSLGHVTSVAAKTLAAGDVPTLAVSKISGLQSSLDSKLPKATFDDLFEKVTLSDGTVAIHAKYGFYSDGFVSGKGANPSAGESGGTAYNRLDTWEGYTDELATWVLSAGLGHSLYNDVQSLKKGAAVSFTIQGSGNAVTDVTKSGTSLVFTKGLAFLTSHQNIYALTIQGNGTAIDKYTPNSAAKTINITPANIGAATSGHTHSQYLTAVSLATISDLHSSWDSVLKAQKPAWLTSVSLATISDLHSSWDALLKAAPSAYVTRWPTAAEVGALTQSAADGRYVNITGDTMTGDLGIGNGRASIDGSVPYCGSSGIVSKDLTELANYKTVLGAYTDKSGTWYALISVRHRNGFGDGNNYGLYLRSVLTAPGNLMWGKQYGSSGWQAERVILDSANYTSYTVTKTGGGASGTWGIGISGNAATASKWATARTISLGQDSTGSVSLDGSANVTLNARNKYIVGDRSSQIAVSGASGIAAYSGATGFSQWAFGVARNMSRGYISVLKPGADALNVTAHGTILCAGTGDTHMFIGMDYNSANVRVGGGNADKIVWQKQLAFMDSNVASATKLQTARTINGTSFNGTANITTANWGTARNISIASSNGSGAGSAVSVNGSANVTLKLPATITATLSGSATSLSLSNRMDYGWNGLNYFNGNLPNGCAAKVNDAPTAGWWHILRFNHADNDGYYTDLAVPINASNGLYWKNVRGGGLLNPSWIRILDTLDYTSYTVTKTGGGASGTWGIGISGNAATASKWATARTISLGQDSTGSVSLDGSANVTLNARNKYIVGDRSSQIAVSGISGIAAYSGATGFSQWAFGVTRNMSRGYISVLKPVSDALNVKANGTILCAGHGDTHMFIGMDYGSANVRVGGGNADKINWQKQLAFMDSNVASATKLQTARTLWGQSFNGTGNVSGSLSGVGSISASGNFSTSKATNTYLAGNQGQALVNSTASAGAYVMLHRGCSTNGYFTLGTYQGTYLLQYTAKSTVTAGNNSVTKSLTLLDEAGNSTFPGTLHASGGIYSDQYVSAKGQNTSSDMRLKDVLGSVTLPLERIAKAPSFEFRWKDGSGESAGSSAQYWRSVLPAAVRERDGYLEMQYGNIALISAVAIARETMRVDREVTRLREECRRLRGRVARLEEGRNTGSVA